MSRHREVFEVFAGKAEEQLGDSLKQLYLYGSVARGEETSESDVDIFAVVEDEGDLEELRELAYDLGVLDNGVVLNVQGRTKRSFNGFEATSYLRNISREGVRYA